MDSTHTLTKSQNSGVCRRKPTTLIAAFHQALIPSESGAGRQKVCVCVKIYSQQEIRTSISFLHKGMSKRGN